MATSNSGNCGDPVTNYPSVTNCPEVCVPVNYFPQNASLTSCFNGQALPQPLEEISTNNILWSTTGVADCLPNTFTTLTEWLTWVEENLIQQFCDNAGGLTCDAVRNALGNADSTCIPDSNDITDLIGFTNGGVFKLPPGTQGDWLRISTVNGAITWDTITCDFIKTTLENNGTSCIGAGSPTNLIGFNQNGILETLSPGNDGTYLCLQNGVPTWSSLAANVNIDCATLLDLLQPIEQGGTCINQITGSHPIILGYNPVSGTVQWGDAYDLPSPTQANTIFYSTGAGAEQNNTNWTAAPTNDGDVLTYDETSNSLIWQNPNPTCTEIVTALETGNCIPVGSILNLIGFNNAGQLMQLPPTVQGDILQINQFGEPQFLALDCNRIKQILEDGACILAGTPTSLIGFSDNGILETLAPNNEGDRLVITNGIPTWQGLQCDEIRNAIQAQPSCVPQTNLASALYVVDENGNWDSLDVGDVGQVLTTTGAGIEWQDSTAVAITCADITGVLTADNCIPAGNPNRLIGYDAGGNIEYIPAGTIGQIPTVQADGSLLMTDPVTVDCATVLAALDQNCLTVSNTATGLWVVEPDGTNHRLDAATVGDILRVQADGSLAFETLTCQIIRDILENNMATCLDQTTISASLLSFDAAGDLDFMVPGTNNQILTSITDPVTNTTTIEWTDPATVTIDCATILGILDTNCVTADPISELWGFTAGGDLRHLDIGTAGQYLRVNATATEVEWFTLDCGEIVSILDAGNCLIDTTVPANFVVTEADGSLHTIDFNCQTIRDIIENNNGTCIEDTTDGLQNLFGLDVANGNWDKLPSNNTAGDVLTIQADGSINWSTPTTIDCASITAALTNCLPDGAPTSIWGENAAGTPQKLPAGGQDTLLSVNAAGEIEFRNLTCAEILTALENGGATCIPTQADASTINQLITIDADGNIERVPDCNWLNHSLRSASDATEAGCIVEQTDPAIAANRVLGISTATGNPEYFCVENQQLFGAATFDPVVQNNVTNGQRIQIPITQNALIDDFDNASAFTATSFQAGEDGIYSISAQPNMNIQFPNVANGLVSVVSAIVITAADGITPIQEYRLNEQTFSINDITSNPINGTNWTLPGNVQVRLQAGQAAFVRLYWSAVANTGATTATINASGLATTFMSVSRVDQGIRIVGGNC